VKDPVDVGPPSGYHILVVLRVEDSGDRTPSTLLGDFFLDLLYGPDI